MKALSRFSSIPTKRSNQTQQKWTCERALAELRKLGEKRNVEGMAHFGIVAKNVYGVAKPKMDELARVAGVADLVGWLERLKDELGIPAKLGPLGVKEEHIPRLVDVAEKDLCHQTNPRACTRGDFDRLFRAAL